ncbi:MAG: AbrB/MazE/SpoVT family DNA-binding domain-containing protein [Halobacteriales archaeon]
MSETDDAATEDTYGEAEINDRGRLTIPKALRDDLQIEGGTRFTVIREGGDIRLVRQLPELQTLSSGKSRDEWGEETFRDAGTATFGGQ